MGKNFLWAGTFGLWLILSVPLAWALDMGASEVDLNNFERPLLGSNQLYLNLNTGITWHNDNTMFDNISTEVKVRDRWHQWNAGGELGFGITDKIMARVWGNFDFPAFSEPKAVRSRGGPFGVDGENGSIILWKSNANSRGRFDEDFTRWRKSENFGANLVFRPTPKGEFYITTDGAISWFREDIHYRITPSWAWGGWGQIMSQKAKVRDRNFQQELLAGFKYILEIPVNYKATDGIDLRRSPQPKIIDLNQWDRVLLHKGQIMINPYGGVRFVDRRRTFFVTPEDSLSLGETRDWTIWTNDETARDVFTQGILGASAAVGITDKLLLEGAYKYYLPVSYKRFVTRKSGNGYNFFDENDRGKNEGWAGNAKLTFRANPWFQVFLGYSGQSDTDSRQFFGKFSLIGFSSTEVDKGEKELRLAEHRVFAGFTFLTRVTGTTNPGPEAKRTLSDFQRPLLRPLQLGTNIYGGWRYVKDVFVITIRQRGTWTDFFVVDYNYKFRAVTDRSYSQGFIGGDVYLGIFENFQFDTSASFFTPTRYDINLRTNKINVSSHFYGEEVAWDVSPRFIYRPLPNFEAFLAANFGQVRSAVINSNHQEFTKYNVNGGIKMLFP